jgi:hypothetical protein
MALYKVIRHRGTARTLRGARSERDARLRQAEGTGLSYSVTDRTRDAASQPTRAVRGRPRLEQRVKASHIEGTFRRMPSAGPGGCWRAGLRSSRGSAHAPDRTPTVRPDSRDFGPPARPREGLLMMAMPHRREATWQTTARPDLGATFARVGAN